MCRKQTNAEARPRVLPVSAAVLAAVLLSGTTTDDASVLETRRHKIEIMSQSQLNQLKRNYENYLKLSPARREQFDRLNEELEQDAKSGGRLTKLMEGYNDWLFTLSPFEREKLLSTSDPGERAQLVQKLLQEQQKQRLARASRAHVALLPARLDGPAAPLSANELDTVLGAVEQTFLTDETRKRLPQTQAPRDRHIQILRLTMDQLRRERDDGTKMRPRETELVNTILVAIPNKRIKSQITRSSLPQQIRRQLGQILGRSVLAEWKPELDEAPVTAAQIDETTTKWLTATPAERRDAMQERLQTENGRKYVAAVVALQTNARLKEPAQPVLWLLRRFPSPPPMNRLNRSAGQAGSSKQSAGAKAPSRAADDPEKDSSSTE